MKLGLLKRYVTYLICKHNHFIVVHFNSTTRNFKHPFTILLGEFIFISWSNSRASSKFHFSFTQKRYNSRVIIHHLELTIHSWKGNAFYFSGY